MLALLLACQPDSDPTGATVAAPTWHQDVAPIVVASCGGCHTEGGIAPFALDTYEAASAQAAAMVASVDAGRMPPWDAVTDQGCTPELGWQDDPSLTAEERALLAAWADGGALEGDAASATELPSPADVTLVDATGHLAPSQAFITAGMDDQFACVSLDPGVMVDTWLTGLQVVPDDDQVVHHVLVFSDPEAETAKWGDAWQDCFNVPTVSGMQLLGAWAPGAPPFTAPETSAMPVSAGTRFIMQVHYHPAGSTGSPDQTALDLRFSDVTPDWGAMIALIGNAGSAGEGLLSGPNDTNPDEPEFRIPAGAADHTETIEFAIPRDVDAFRIFGAGTHMHYIGTGMEVRWERRTDDHGPDEECLVETSWDFNWQRMYYYDAAIEDLPVGDARDRIWMECLYNNTTDNPGVAQALADAGLSEPVDVYLGETTLDEMCLSVLGILYEL